MARSARRLTTGQQTVAKSVPSGRLVGLAAAAEEFSVSTKTIRRRIADGTVRAYRIGRLIRIDLDDARAELLVPVSNAR